MAMSTVPTAVLSQQVQDAVDGRRVRCAVFTPFSFAPAFFELHILPLLFDQSFRQPDKIRRIQLDDALRAVDNVAVYYDRQALAQDGAPAQLDYRRIDVGRGTGYIHPKVVLLLVDDDTGVSRVVVDGEDVELPVPLTLPATLRVNLRSGEPGPQLLRIEVVDEAGRTTFGELAVGFNPILERGEATEALTIDISGDSGYDELEVIVEPFLDGIPELLNESVRGVRLFNGNILGVPVEVDGDRVEIDGPIDLDLFPSDLAGGRVGLRVRLERLRFFGDGESDFGFLGTDEWDAIWTGNNIDIIGTFAFQPSVDGERLEIVSDGFTVEIGSSDFSVSGFLDPIGIFDALVNALSGLFSGQVEDAVRDACLLYTSPSPRDRG